MKTPNLFDQIQLDMTDGYTYDMPSLRYSKGPIPVFLWDSLQDYPTLMSLLESKNHSKDYKYMYGKAYTKELLLPWYNLSTKYEEYEAFCLGETSDLNELEIPEWATGNLQPLSGKVVGLSLRALRKLDSHFLNGYCFTRQMIDVIPFGPHNKDRKKSIQVYTYFNEIEDVGELNRSKNTWKLRDDFDLLPFRDKGGVYEM